MADVTLDPTTRAPSAPIAGALRWGTQALAGVLVGLLVRWGLDAEQAKQTSDAVAVGVGGLAAAGLAALGKWGRDRGAWWARFF